MVRVESSKKVVAFIRDLKHIVFVVSISKKGSGRPLQLYVSQGQFIKEMSEAASDENSSNYWLPYSPN